MKLVFRLNHWTESFWTISLKSSLWVKRAVNQTISDSLGQWPRRILATYVYEHWPKSTCWCRRLAVIQGYSRRFSSALACSSFDQSFVLSVSPHVSSRTRFRKSVAPSRPTCMNMNDIFSIGWQRYSSLTCLALKKWKFWETCGNILDFFSGGSSSASPLPDPTSIDCSISSAFNRARCTENIKVEKQKRKMCEQESFAIQQNTWLSWILRLD